MSHAGFPIDDAPKFWRRMAAAYPSSIKSRYGASHPSTAQRDGSARANRERDQEKIARGEYLSPNMKDGKMLAKAPTNSKPATVADSAMAGKPQPQIIEAAMAPNSV
jgi:hypothetical protein